MIGKPMKNIDKDCVNEEFNLDWAKLGKNDGAVESLSDIKQKI